MYVPSWVTSIYLNIITNLSSLRLKYRVIVLFWRNSWHNNLKKSNFITKSNTRILDLIITLCNLTTSIEHCDSPLVPEDQHRPSVSININIPLIDQRDVNVKCRPGILKYNFWKADCIGLYNALAVKDWSTITEFDDVNDAWNVICEELYNILDMCVPRCSIRLSTNPPWFTLKII